jgi:hypothetical protein
MRSNPEPALTAMQLTRLARQSVAFHICDGSDAEPIGTAIYTLADPRDVRRSRYVGQSRAPRRRFLQHIGVARLWMPDEAPWWVKIARHRPLYEWIRSVHRDECRLPVMVIASWVETAGARAAERALIQSCLRQGLPLLNVESATLDAQLPLL